MAGRRALTPKEERKYLRLVRRLPLRDRALITTQWLTGYRISEVLSLRIEQVWRNGQVTESIGVPPRCLKGRRGSTRWVPVCPELRRVLHEYIAQRIKEHGPIDPGEPLILSRQRAINCGLRPISRTQAHTIIKAAMRRAKITDDGRLGSHSHRKTLARKVYNLSGHDLLVTRDSLGHSSVMVTERYLETSRDEINHCIMRGDFTRSPRRRRRAA